MSKTSKRAREETSFPRGGQVTKKVKKSSGQKPMSWSEIKRQKKRTKIHMRSEMEVEQKIGVKTSEDGIGYVGEVKARNDVVPSKAGKVNVKFIEEEGMLVLGVIREVNEFELVISLPDSNMGVVSIAEISDTLVGLLEKDSEGYDVVIPELEDMFEVGQYVKVAIIGTDGGNKLELSMRESIVNSGLSIDTIVPKMNIVGSIKSVEDHGFIVSFGLSKASGFLLRSNVPDAIVDSLQIGHLLDLLVLSVDKNSKIVQLSADPKAVAKTRIKSEKSFLWSMVRPGMLVQSSILHVLPNGLWLQFMGYFTGSVNSNHLDKEIDLKEIPENYPLGSKVKARVIMVDTTNKKVFLSLKKPIVKKKKHFFPHKVGDILDGVVYKIDGKKGLGIEFIGEESCYGYAYKNLVSDKFVKSLEKSFPIGTEVKSRILSINEFENMATVSMKEYHLKLPLLSYSDVNIGDMISGEITSVNDSAVSVKITNKIKAFCPRFHMGDFTVSYPDKVFIPGKRFSGKVLELDTDQKKIVITHKKSLINSDLPIIKSYQDIPDGLITHGYIISVKPYGVLMGFYNNVKGLVKNEHLTGHDVRDPSELYNRGEVHRCRVIESNAAEQRLFLSFLINPEEANPASDSEFNEIKCGEILTGSIKSVRKDGLEVQISKNLTGFVPIGHLSDFSEFCAKIRKQCSTGMEVDVLVWEKNEKKKRVTLTMKRSLIMDAENDNQPKKIQDMVPGKLYFGVVTKITSYGVFVHFLNRLAGLATKSSMADTFVSNVEDFFEVDQTVLAYCVAIDPNAKKVDLNLKPSFCSSKDHTFLEQYLETRNIFQKRKSGIDWDTYSMGNVVEGTIVQTADIGYVVTFEEERLTGFAHINQTKGAPSKVGSKTSCLILDSDKTNGIVDISIRPELFKKKKMKQLETGRSKGTIELVQSNYLIVSVESSRSKKSNLPLLMYAPAKSINSMKYGVPFDEFSVLGKVTISVDMIGDDDEPIIASIVYGKKIKRDVANISALNDIYVGMESPCVIRNIFKTHMNIDIGLHVKARVHITEVTEDPLSVHPFSQFEIDQKIPACKVLAIKEKTSKGDLAITRTEKRTRKYVYATLRPSAIALPDGKLTSLPTFDTLKKGQVVLGWIHEITNDAIWVHLSMEVRGRVFILDASDDVDVLRNIDTLFSPGQSVKCKVVSFDKDRKTVDLSIKATEKKKGTPYAPNEIKPGMIIPGRYSRVVLGNCLNIQLFAHTYGQVFITDVHDRVKSDPLSGFETRSGDFDMFYVLDIDRANDVIYLSLRESRVSGKELDEKDSPEITSYSDITEGQLVKGYVKNCTDKTCYIALSHDITAIVYLSNLSDKFIKNPKSLYFAGRKVTGRVLKVDASKGEVHLTLKESQVRKKNLTIVDVQRGMIVKGWVKSITDFGVFVSLKDSSLVGLCHISEITDGFADPAEMFRKGDYVKAYVLKKDEKKKQLSLSMKPSYLEGTEDMEISEESSSIDNDKMSVESSEESDEPQNSKEEESSDSSSDQIPENLGGFQMYPSDESSSSSEEAVGINTVWNDFKFQTVSQQASMEESSESSEEVNVAKSRKEKLAQKAKEEDDFRAQEDAMLEDTAPKTKEDYEKLILEHPRSSYIWVQYMAYWLNLTEFDQARAVAERALQKIDASYQGEKFNIWVALMNLENNFGTKESVGEVFKRALQYSDKKKIYFAAIKMYQSSGNHDLVEELYKTLIKKFKTHKSVWIKYAIYLYKQVKSDEARKLLTRALKSLPTRKHIPTISKFAQLEFKLGTAERGRTIYEDLITTYPKRTDIWNVFIDQETRLGDVDKIRQLYERVTSLDLPAKKMKHFFKRFLTFETKLGDSSRTEYVKQKTIQYVESKM